MVATPIGQSHWSTRIEAIARSQDKQAFAELFDFFAPRIKSFVMSLDRHSTSHEMAEEIVQEVLLKVWRKADCYNANTANVSTWIYTIARNTRIDFLRKHRFEECPLEVEDIWDEAATDETPLQSLQQQKARQKLDENMRQLPEEQRQVLFKSFMEGKSHSEISEELNISLGTVKSRIRLAMQKLALIVDR